MRLTARSSIITVSTSSGLRQARFLSFLAPTGADAKRHGALRYTFQLVAGQGTTESAKEITRGQVLHSLLQHNLHGAGIGGDGGDSGGPAGAAEAGAAWAAADGTAPGGDGGNGAGPAAAGDAGIGDGGGSDAARHRGERRRLRVKLCKDAAAGKFNVTWENAEGPAEGMFVKRKVR